MKKILSLILAVLFVFSAFSVFAVTASAEDAKTPVVRMYIWVKFRTVGHSGLYFENLTDHDVTVGCYTLPAGQGVSVSSANISKGDGKGNYYNCDSYSFNKYGKGNMSSASTTLTESQLKTVTARILSRNTYEPLRNCDYFSTWVWNSVAPSQIKYSPSPVVQKYLIKKSSCSCSNPNFYNPSQSQCFKQVGTNGGAYLKQATGKSFGQVG